MDNLSNLKREIVFNPAYDKRNSDPKKNYGIHGVDMCWYLSGPLGCIQFLIYTNWHLPHVQGELDGRQDSRFPHLSCHPTGADFGYHSPVPQYEGQTPVNGECRFVENGQPCYYYGSSLYAEEVLKKLIAEGGEAVWKLMEESYVERFHPETEGRS